MSEFDVEFDVVDVDDGVALAAVFVGLDAVPSRLASVCAVREREVNEILVGVAPVGEAIANPVVEVARSLITVGDPSVKTFESSLQHVLPSE